MAGARGVSRPNSPSLRPGKQSVHHHGSHRLLLHSRPALCFPTDVDAIIVPTARKAATLMPAIELAGKLRCTLVALCSKWSSVREVVGLARGKGVELIAVDVNDPPLGVVPFFETDRVLRGTRFERWSDTSLKRNLGLLLARLIGWERIVFLDDDIVIPEPMDLREAAALTDRYAGVGLTIDDVHGMPDNSVVCHAFRAAGGEQDIFIGGGALAVGAKSMTSFFPNIYNEDWFFLLDDDGLRPTTSTGTAIQKRYDPFRDHRARMEELGDVLAEGLFWLLDNKRSLQDATAEHWQSFLHKRVSFITDVIGMVERMGGDPGQRRRMLSSLKAARGRCQYIQADLCESYVDAWRADRGSWQRHVEEIHRALVTKKRKGKRERRSLAGVRGMLRSLEFSDRMAYLHFPQERLDQDLTDFDSTFADAVSQ